MDVLAEQGRARLIPSLVLYHPSEEVVLRALEMFGHADRRDVAAAVRHLIGHPSARLRAAALQALNLATPEERELLRAATRDASGSVRAAALVGLAAAGEATPETDRLLEDLLQARIRRRRSPSRTRSFTAPRPASRRCCRGSRRPRGSRGARAGGVGDGHAA